VVDEILAAKRYLILDLLQYDNFSFTDCEVVYTKPV
jgi:hypothetical protein